MDNIVVTVICGESNRVLAVCPDREHVEQELAHVACETGLDASTLAVMPAYDMDGYYQLLTGYPSEPEREPGMQYDKARNCFAVAFPDGRLLCTTVDNFLEAVGMMPLAWLDEPENWLLVVDGETVWIEEQQNAN